jgi:hypothetical protein
MSVILSGSITLNGKVRAEIISDKITLTSRVFLKGLSGPIKGTIVISEMTVGVGFGLSSTSEEDINVIVYFDVIED